MNASLRIGPRTVAAAIAVTVVAIALLLLSSCAPRTGPLPITQGAPCAVCGMGIENMRFASERMAGDAFRFYDAIECLLRDETATGPAWLTDYDAITLHAADSMWVVKGDIPSPMGGGFVAFIDRGAADDVARETDGRVGRLSEFTSVQLESAP